MAKTFSSVSIKTFWPCPRQQHADPPPHHLTLKVVKLWFWSRTMRIVLKRACKNIFPVFFFIFSSNKSLISSFWDFESIDEKLFFSNFDDLKKYMFRKFYRIIFKLWKKNVEILKMVKMCVHFFFCSNFALSEICFRTFTFFLLIFLPFLSFLLNILK